MLAARRLPGHQRRVPEPHRLAAGSPLLATSCRAARHGTCPGAASQGSAPAGDQWAGDGRWGKSLSLSLEGQPRAGGGCEQSRTGPCHVWTQDAQLRQAAMSRSHGSKARQQAGSKRQREAERQARPQRRPHTRRLVPVLCHAPPPNHSVSPGRIVGQHLPPADGRILCRSKHSDVGVACRVGGRKAG